MAKALVGLVVVSAVVSVTVPAFSQADPPPTGAYPDAGPAPEAAAATAPVANQPAAPAYQAPAAPPPAYQAPAAPPPNPAPAAAAPTYNPPPAAAPAGNPPPSSAPPQDGYNVGSPGVVEPPPPPPPARSDEGEGKGFEFPDISIRADPLNWLIFGRLGIELEASVYKFITAEIVPVFVTTKEPPAMNLGSFPATLSQHSNGIGAMSGASIGAGFWLDGKPFRGTVLRVYYTNYGYRYNSTSVSTTLGADEATRTERRLGFMLGSHSRWGAFTLASGIGLGYELNRVRRCFANGIDAPATNDGCPKDTFEIRVPGDNGVVSQSRDLNDWLHPFYLEFRLSLGVVF